MQLEGLHHVTMVTADARRTVHFYAEILGLRLVKKTVNFDAPQSYHLYFGDERGSPGSILTWFEFVGAPQGRPGAGMIHVIELGVPSDGSLDFWRRRLRQHGYEVSRAPDAVRVRDHDGLAVELVITRPGTQPLQARHPDVPMEHAITGVEGARSYSAYAGLEETLLTDTLGFDYAEGTYSLRGRGRCVGWVYEPPPDRPGRHGAGTVHHIAWAVRDDEHTAWQRRVRDAGASVTDVRDRDYFRSIYFRDPRGILFEIATLSPGFAVDEDPEHLGEELRVPEMHAHLREQLERTLTPIANPRAAQPLR